MNQEQLESLNLDDLPYPMFETTEEEKGWLEQVYPLLTAHNSDQYLCCILDDTFGMDIVGDLIGKVQSSLGGCLSLVSYLGVFDLSWGARADLRRVWIRKLLEYTGEGI